MTRSGPTSIPGHLGGMHRLFKSFKDPTRSRSQSRDGASAKKRWGGDALSPDASAWPSSSNAPGPDSRSRQHEQSSSSTPVVVDPALSTSTVPPGKHVDDADGDGKNTRTQSSTAGAIDGTNNGRDQSKDSRSKSLWDLAYEQLGKADGDLVTGYKAVLSSELKRTSASWLHGAGAPIINATDLLQIPCMLPMPNLPLAFSPENSRLAGTIEGGRIDIWDISSGSRLHQFNAHNFTADSLVFSRDGKLLASSGGGGFIKIWDTRSEVCVKTLKDHGPDYGIDRHVALIPDCQLLASCGPDRTVRVWDARNGNCLRTLSTVDDESIDGFYAIAFSQDGKFVAAGASLLDDESYVGRWDINSGAYLRGFGDGYGNITSVAFSPDGKHLAVSNRNFNAASGFYSTATIWDTKNGDRIGKIDIGKAVYGNISFDATGSYLLTDMDIVSLDAMSTTNTVSAGLKNHSYGLTGDGTWIKWKNRKVLWLPAEYRRKCSTVAPGLIAIGCETGRVFIYGFSDDVSPYDEKLRVLDIDDDDNDED